MNKQVERIRAEIDRRLNEITIKVGEARPRLHGKRQAYLDVLNIINSLPEEKPSKGQSEKSKKDCNGCPHCVDRKDQYGWHFKGCIGGPYNGKFIAEIDECPLKQEQPSKGLEEAANRYAENNTKEEYHTDEGIIQTYGIANNAFISGANWQKEQMMRDAVDYRIVNNLAAYPIIYYDVHHLGLKYGDKVKLIILKDDEK